MTHEQMMHQLNSIRENLEHTLDQVKDMIEDVSKRKCKIDRVRGESASMPDSFSEDKESFIAP